MIVGNSFHGLMHKIGRYQVEHELGRGAMGIVYRAFDPAIGRRIAIKTIRLDELGDDKSRADLRERLLREAQSAGILSHPNIVTIYDVSEDAQNAYIYMEFVEGATLDSFARGLPVQELLSILEQTAEALDYAHGRGIVHRDIKPGNLMLSGRQVKVTDFGIARLLHRDSTQSGTLLGTPSYMSPEQVAGAEVTGATDQYALGVIAYEFLAGVKPFDNDNLANLLYRITQMPVPPVSALNAATNQVLARALSKNPAHRYPTCSEFAAALEHALGLQPPKFTPQRESSGDEPTIVDGATIPTAPVAVNLPPLQLPPAPKPTFWKPLVGTLFGASVLIGILWFSFGRRQAPPVTPPAVEQASGEVKPSPMGDKVPTPAETSAVPQATQAAASPLEIQPVPKTEEKSQTLASHAVEFVSAPPGAEVLINNGEQDRCPRTPCTLDLPEGEFQATVRLAGFEDTRRSLRVPMQNRLSVDFEKPQGTIIVNSNPNGAIVKIDGRDSGQKTPAMLKLAPGKYTLEVVKEGLPAQTQEVTVRNGVIQTLAIQWN
jgi:serine/threonine protein kinase